MHVQSILHPAGIEAARVSHLWWVMFWICAVVWVRSRDRRADRHQPRPPRHLDRRRSARLGRSVAAAAGVSVDRADRAAVRERRHRTGARLRCVRPMRCASRSPATSGGGTSSTKTRIRHCASPRPMRFTCRSASRSDRSALERRHPQPVDSQPAGQDRSRFPGATTSCGCRPIDPASIADSAPSPAACSTPRWRSSSSPSRPATSSAGSRRIARPPPAPTAPDTQRGKRRFRARSLRDVPHHQRNDGRRRNGAGPDAYRLAEHHRRPAACPTHRATLPAGSPIRSTSNPVTTCRSPGLTSDELQAVLAYLETLK